MVKYTLSKAWSSLRLRYTVAAVFAAVLLGAVFAPQLYAGVVSLFSQETEGGAVAGSATIVADGTASGGSAVKFGAVSSSGDGCQVASRVTVTSANQSTYPAYPLGTQVYTPDGPDPWGGCWPNASNTGVPAGTQLTDYTGPCIISTPNTVIDKKP